MYKNDLFPVRFAVAMSSAGRSRKQMMSHDRKHMETIFFSTNLFSKMSTSILVEKVGLITM